MATFTVEQDPQQRPCGSRIPLLIIVAVTLIAIIIITLVMLYLLGTFSRGTDSHDQNCHYQYSVMGADLGGQAILKCDIPGLTGSSDAIWTLNGKTISENVVNETLHIKYVHTETQGVYGCYYGADQSRERMIILRINSKPNILQNGLLVDAPLHKATTIFCKTEGYPIPKVTWFKEGVTLPDRSDKYRLFPNALEILNLEKADNGSNYKCVATNEKGETATASTSLTVF